MDWLNRIDPNIIISVGISLATWLWHKAAGKKAAVVEDIVSDAVRAILSEIVDHVPSNVPVDTYLKGARDYVERRIWTALQKRGVPKNSTTIRLVNAAIERATSQLGAEIAEERRRKEG